MKISDSQTSIIKVCILEDDDEYRHSLKKILSQNNQIRIYGEFSNAHDCIQSFYSPFKAEVCLIDIIIKGNKTGIECAQVIAENWPEVHLIIMTSYLDPSYLAESKRLNADFIEKGTRAEVIIDKLILNRKRKPQERLISLAQSNENIQPIELINQIQKAQSNISKLSVYQKKVLQLKLEGKSVTETAVELQMNPRTVRTHLRRAFQKLELPDILKYIHIEIDT